jgi:hypothetical protein
MKKLLIALPGRFSAQNDAEGYLSLTNRIRVVPIITSYERLF